MAFSVYKSKLAILATFVTQSFYIARKMLVSFAKFAFSLSKSRILLKN